MKENYSIKDYIASPIVTKISAEENKLREFVMDYIITNHKPYSIKNDPNEELLKIMANKNILSINENNEIVSIYPVSAIKTNKKVIFEDGRYGYAMCAIDAIGFHYTFKKNIKIEGNCEYCNSKIILDVKNGKINVIEGNENIHILHTDLEKNKNWSCCCCNIMHFFDCKESLEKWQTKNNINTKTFAVNLETGNKIAWLLFSQ
ncbi:MerB-like organometallic lyase SaoL [Eubacterium multiforme]|uniref:Alkylmercury lyase n=1 Tax=Eubacterium multiforme TaxID=83339 RepID=A0ABT9UXM2_9FIRM|nr:MerB-like organometallic lyase SaoL [Eubacterium multiforme]MDQ0151068.1 hypothetical protein [Eubacterium multiforme]